MPGITKAGAEASKQAQARVLRWGDRGVSERLTVQDAQDNVTPRGTRIRLEESGILSELQHHFSGAVTITPGTGTATKDNFGPYPLVSSYSLSAGSNTPLISLSGRMLGLLQEVEYPDRSWEANSLPASVMAPLADVSSVFNHPSASGNLRFWARMPVALRWLGMPGGSVGYLILQNKRISNVLNMQYNVSGSAPYSLAGTVAGQAAYDITGNATVTGNLVVENWKSLHTVPDARSKMPVYGFTRYISEAVQAYTSSTFKYFFEPGGLLLRAFAWFLDGDTAGITDAQLSSLSLSYGTNKQVDIYTPYRNRLQQLQTYGRMLPQGCYALDYYTANRNTVDAKSTENTANIQIQAQFASGYTPAAGSQARILLDKVYVVQNRIG